MLEVVLAGLVAARTGVPAPAATSSLTLAEVELVLEIDAGARLERRAGSVVALAAKPVAPGKDPRQVIWQVEVNDAGRPRDGNLTGVLSLSPLQPAGRAAWFRLRLDPIPLDLSKYEGDPPAPGTRVELLGQLLGTGRSPGPSPKFSATRSAPPIQAPPPEVADRDEVLAVGFVDSRGSGTEFELSSQGRVMARSWDVSRPVDDSWKQRFQVRPRKVRPFFEAAKVAALDAIEVKTAGLVTYWIEWERPTSTQRLQWGSHQTDSLPPAIQVLVNELWVFFRSGGDH